MVPRDRDQPESMDVQRSWLFGLRGTLTSTHPRILDRAEVGLTVIPRSKPSLGLVVRADSTPLCQLARMTRCLGASQHCPSSLVPAGLGVAGLGEKAQVNPGAATPAQPRRCPLPGALPGPIWRGLQEVRTHWDWPSSC